MLRSFVLDRGQLLDKDVTSDKPGNSLQIGCAEQIFLQGYLKNVLLVLDASAAQWLCSAPKAGEAAVKKKRENGFRVVIFVGCLAVSWDQSGIMAPVVEKEDRVAQKEPCFKMQTRPASPVSSNKAVRSRWMPARPPWNVTESISATPVNAEYVVWSLHLPSFLSPSYTVLIPVYASMFFIPGG